MAYHLKQDITKKIINIIDKTEALFFSAFGSEKSHKISI